MAAPGHDVSSRVHAGPRVLAHGDSDGGHGEPHQQPRRGVALVVQAAGHQHHQEGREALHSDGSSLELQTKVHNKVRNHEEGPYKGLLLVESSC